MNVEKVTRDWLAARFPAARVVTESPSGMAADSTYLPVVKVVGLGGPKRFTLGSPGVDVEVYHSSRSAARDFADEVDGALLWEFHGAQSGMTVTSVRTFASPSWRPYDNTSLRRFGATYQVFLK